MCRNIFNFGFYSVKRKLRISPGAIIRLVLDKNLIFKSFPVLLYSLWTACTSRVILIKKAPIPQNIIWEFKSFFFFCFLLNNSDHSSHFPPSCQKLVTTALPSKTIQEGCNQKDLRLFVSSSPSSNDKETPWFASKSLLHYDIKLLSALFPIKKIPPPPP